MGLMHRHSTHIPCRTMCPFVPCFTLRRPVACLPCAPLVSLADVGGCLALATKTRTSQVDTFLASTLEVFRQSIADSSAREIAPNRSISSRDTPTSSLAFVPSQEAFLWMKFLQRQRRWYRNDNGIMLRDELDRFIPTEANPFPTWSPHDKLMERALLAEMGVPVAPLLATFSDPE